VLLGKLEEARVREIALVKENAALRRQNA